jgi:hydroxymethylpyrimidine/phosphomethylpyrimidine kinase
MPRHPQPPVALSIAGSDPSGGAGIQADLKTFSALEVYGAAAIAALTAQDTRGVSAVRDVPPDFVAEQVERVLDDLDVRAVKVGMLSRAAVVEAVAERLEERRARNIVVDPVMVSKSGAALLLPEAVEVLRARLAPLALVLTPNLPEAAVLLAVHPAEIERDPAEACRQLLRIGSRAVVLKGGHAGGERSDDLYFDGGEIVRLPAHRVETRNTHGTGCTYSAAIAAFLARGEEPLEACRAAKRYVSAAIEAASKWQLGHGHGPVHHFHALWPVRTI